MFNTVGGFNVAAVQNDPPIAVIQGGNITVDEGARYNFYATGSTGGSGNIVTYQWSNDAGITINNPNAAQCDLNPTPAVGGSFRLTLVITNDLGDSSTTSITITVSDITPPEIEVLGDNPTILNVGTPFVDPGARVTDNVDPTYTTYSTTEPDASVEGETEIQYAATDSAGNVAVSKTRMVIYEAVPVEPPTAVAGQRISVSSGATFKLSAAGSSDPQGLPLSYAWAQISGPDIDTRDVDLSKEEIELTAPQLEDNDSVVFQVTVSNGAESAVDSVAVNIFAASSGITDGPRHGVYVSEVPTRIKPPVTAEGFLPVIVGTAPVNLADSPKVNEPVLCHTYAEAVAAMGYSDDFESYTLCEHIHAQFALYGVAPVVLINVLDPAVHKTFVDEQIAVLVSGEVTLRDMGIIKDSVTVRNEAGDTEYEAGTDYTLTFNSYGEMTIYRTYDGSIGADDILLVDYDKLAPDSVDDTDIIGGVDSDGIATGLELISEVFPRFRMVPTHGAAPGFSTSPAVRAVGLAKMKMINNNFRGQWLSDIPADSITRHADAISWKASNDYSAPHEIVCWPKVRTNERIFHLSTHVLCVIGTEAIEQSGVLNVTPSNRSIQVDASVLSSGRKLYLQQPQANALNGDGIVTALNFIGGWKAWGNRTSAYPATNDPKDSLIKIRGFQNWLANSIILMYWERVDGDLNRRQIESATDSVNIWLNGLVSADHLIGGRVEFLEEDNPVSNLLDGKTKFRIYQASPPPNRDIEFVIEYDADYLNTLFG